MFYTTNIPNLFVDDCPKKSYFGHVINNDYETKEREYMKHEECKKGQIVILAIPAVHPIKLQDGRLHEGGHRYKVLGHFASVIRLSRVGDCAKLSVLPDKLIPDSVSIKSPAISAANIAQDKIDAAIRQHVGDYRKHYASIKEAQADSAIAEHKENFLRNQERFAAKSLGAIEMLYDLQPANPLWAKLQWANY